MKNLIRLTAEATIFVPSWQIYVTNQNLEAHQDCIKRLNAIARTIPKLKKTKHMNDHTAALHYFCGSTDMYFCEFDGKDILSGFIILNGDLYGAKWGYSSVSEIINIPTMNIDYYFKKQSIEAALYRKYPKHFKKPASIKK